jgi:hypothetical protein
MPSVDVPSLKKIYHDVKHPASFGSLSSVHRHLKDKYTKKELQDFLRGEESYTLHFPVRRRLKRDFIFVTNIDEVWGVDLIDFKNIKQYNDGITFVLVAIDILSKFCFVRCLPNKKSNTVRSALLDIFTSTGRKPLKCFVDKGTEFYSKESIDAFKREGIDFYSTENADIKCSPAERMIYTLKLKLNRYFTHSGSYRYVDVIQDIVRNYNNSYHTSIHATPASVTEHNFLHVWRKLYSSKLKRTEQPKPKLSVGDRVRISRENHVFKKGTSRQWSREIFIISNILNRRPHLYVIRDLQDENIIGRFYSHELQKIIPPDFYKIEKVIKTRGVGNKKELYVKWVGYSEKFNSWIRSADLAAPQHG